MTRTDSEDEMITKIRDTMDDTNKCYTNDRTISDADYYKIKMMYMIALELHGLSQEFGQLNEFLVRNRVRL